MTKIVLICNYWGDSVLATNDLRTVIADTARRSILADRIRAVRRQQTKLSPRIGD